MININEKLKNLEKIIDEIYLKIMYMDNISYEDGITLSETLNNIYGIHREIFEVKDKSPKAKERDKTIKQIINSLIALEIGVILYLLFTNISVAIISTILVAKNILLYKEVFNNKNELPKKLVYDQELNYQIINTLYNSYNLLKSKMQTKDDMSIVDQENMNMLMANTYLNECLYGEYPENIPDYIKVFMIKILQDDLKTDIEDLDKLISLAKDKINGNYHDFGRKLTKNDQK